MEIIEVTEGKREFLPLLLLADEQEDMIGRYLDRGTLYAMRDGGVAAAVCVVTDEGAGIAEIKNLAVREDCQRKGYGRAMVEYAAERCRGTACAIQAGTGDSPATVPFYEACGFRRTHRVRDFFTDNYRNPIIDGGVLLRDMVYLRRKLEGIPYPAVIRPLRREETPLLTEFLYEAVYQEKEGRLPRTAIQDPALWRYVERFGERPGDLCLAAETGGLVVGAVWIRQMSGFGFVDGGVPELAMALYPEYRGLGLGRRLLEGMAGLAGEKGFLALSLSVQRENPAFWLYRKAGFSEVRGDEREAVLVRRLG